MKKAHKPKYIATAPTPSFTVKHTDIFYTPPPKLAVRPSDQAQLLSLYIIIDVFLILTVRPSAYA